MSMSADRENRTLTGGRDAQGRWIAGVSANPGGRPRKADCLTDLLRKRPIKVKRQLAAKLWEMALAGNLEAIKYLMDRLEGKPTVHLDQGEGPPSLLIPAPPVERPKIGNGGSA
jgi:hypothetical protein